MSEDTAAEPFTAERFLEASEEEVKYEHARHVTIDKIKHIIAANGKSTKLDFKNRWENLTSKTLEELEICLQNLQEDVVSKQSNETAICIMNDLGGMLVELTGIEAIQTHVLNDENLKKALAQEIQQRGIMIPNLAYIAFRVGSMMRGMWNHYTEIKTNESVATTATSAGSVSPESQKKETIHDRNKTSE